jgi:hypothetical protein
MNENASRAHSGHDHVARLEIAQPPANRHWIRRIRAGHDDHGVHALILHFNKLPVDANERVVIAGGIEIFRRATIAFHTTQNCVFGLGRRATDRKQLRQNMIHLRASRRLHAQP